MTDNHNQSEQPTLWEEAAADAGAALPRQRTKRASRSASRTAPSAGGRGPVEPAELSEERPTTAMEYQELWDVDQVANHLGVPKQTIYAWRSEGKGPKGFRVGKHLRWHAPTVIAWTLGLEREQ